MQAAPRSPGQKKPRLAAGSLTTDISCYVLLIKTAGLPPAPAVTLTLAVNDIATVVRITFQRSAVRVAVVSVAATVTVNAAVTVGIGAVAEAAAWFIKVTVHFTAVTVAVISVAISVEVDTTVTVSIA